MLYIRKANQRGHANFGWLNSYHSFSFGQYYDTQHMGFSSLRVINDDTVDAGMGFGAHGHDNMEIISYVTHGNIVHKDSLGNEFTIPAGDVQRMSAGTGIRHSEFNGSKTDNLKFLQIWIQPNERNVPPSYEQATIIQDGKLTPLVTPKGDGHSLSIHADVSLYRLQLDRNDTLFLPRLNAGEQSRSKYLHLVEGRIEINGEVYEQGDGIGVYEGEGINLRAIDSVHGIWFDLPHLN